MLISLYRKPLHSALGKIWGFSLGSVVKNLPANAGEVGLIPGSERARGEGQGNPLQDSCLENAMDRGAWQAAAHGIAKESNNVHKIMSNLWIHWE